MTDVGTSWQRRGAVVRGAEDMAAGSKVPTNIARVVIVEMPGHQLRGPLVRGRAVITLHSNGATGPIGSFSLPPASVDDLGAAFRSLAAQLAEDDTA